MSFFFYVTGIVRLLLPTLLPAVEAAASGTDAASVGGHSWATLAATAETFVRRYLPTSPEHFLQLVGELRQSIIPSLTLTMGHIFIAADAASFFLTSGLLVLMDGGFIALLKTMFLTPFLSPGGALALYFFSREYELAVEAPVVAAASAYRAAVASQQGTPSGSKKASPRPTKSLKHD
jgi:hypothetical protein